VGGRGGGGGGLGVIRNGSEMCLVILKEN
jgi:hypothetical protein